MDNFDSPTQQGKASLYHKLEDKYYDIVDALHLGKVVDPIDKFVPSFILFIVLIVAIIGIAVFFILGGLPAAGFEVTLTVVDKLTAAEIEDANIFVTHNGLDSSFVTDEFGGAVFTIAGGTIDITVAMEDYREFSESFDINESKTITIELESEELPGDNRTLRIKETGDGLISETARVTFSCSGSAIPPSEKNQSGGVITVEFPSGCGNLTANVSVTGYQDDSIVMRDTTNTIYLDPIELPTGTLKVSVKDEVSGDYLADIRVNVYSGTSLEDQDATDESGIATFELAPGSYYVKGIDESLLKYQQETSLTFSITSDVRTDVELLMKELEGAAGSISLKIEDWDSGDAISNAHVMLIADNRFERDAHSNAAGMLTFSNVDLNSDYAAVVTHEEYVLKTSSNLKTDGTTNTIRLKKANLTTSGSAEVQVIKASDSSRVADATVELYITEHSYPIAISASGTDGNLTFKNLPFSGTYYAKAKKDASLGESEKVELTSTSTPISLVVKIVVETGNLKVLVVDESGQKISNSTVFFYNAVNNVKWKESTTDSNGMTSALEFPWTAKIYVVATKAGYLSRYSSVTELSPNETKILKLALSNESTYSEPEIIHEGIFESDMDVATKLMKNKTYYFKFALVVPDGNYLNFDTVIRAGLQSFANESNCKIIITPEYANSALSAISASANYNPQDVFEDVNTTDGDAKQIRIQQLGIGKGMYDIVVKAHIRADAEAGDLIEIRFATRGKGDAGEIKKPASDMYVIRHALGDIICEPGHAGCPEIIYSFWLNDPTGEHLPEPVEIDEEIVELLQGINYEIEFSVYNGNSAGQTYQDVKLHYFNPEGALSPDRGIIDIGDFPPLTSTGGSFDIEGVAQAALTDLNIGITVSHPDANASLHFKVFATAEMSLATFPDHLIAGLTNFFVVKATDSEGVAINHAHVEMDRVVGNEFVPLPAYSGFTNAQGEHVVPNFPADQYEVGEKFRLTATKAGFELAEPVIIVIESPQVLLSPENGCVEFSGLLEGDYDLRLVRGGALQTFTITNNCGRTLDLKLTSELLTINNTAGSATIENLASNASSTAEVSYSGNLLGQDSIYVSEIEDGQVGNPFKELIAELYDSSAVFTIDKTEFILANGSDSGIITNKEPSSESRYKIGGNFIKSDRVVKFTTPVNLPAYADYGSIPLPTTVSADLWYGELEFRENPMPCDDYTTCVEDSCMLDTCDPSCSGYIWPFPFVLFMNQQLESDNKNSDKAFFATAPSPWIEEIRIIWGEVNDGCPYLHWTKTNSPAIAGDATMCADTTYYPAEQGGSETIITTTISELRDNVPTTNPPQPITPAIWQLDAKYDAVCPNTIGNPFLCGELTGIIEDGRILESVEYFPPVEDYVPKSYDICLDFDKDGDCDNLCPQTFNEDEFESDEILVDVINTAIVSDTYAVLEVTDNTGLLRTKKTEKFHVKLKVGSENSCYSAADEEGITGEEAVPKVLMAWDWGSITLDSETGIIGPCDEDNENFVYCDGVQFLKEIARKLIAISETDEYSEWTPYLRFGTYLTKEGYVTDLIEDFDEFVRENEFADAPVAYTNSSSGVGAFFTPARMKFALCLNAACTQKTENPDPVEIEPGLYAVDINPDFDDSSQELFKAGQPNASFTVTFIKKQDPWDDSILYYLPFDGEVGLNENSLLERTGYGLGYVLDDEPVYIYGSEESIGDAVKTVASASGSTPLANYSVGWQDDFGVLQKTNRGVVLSIDSGQGNLVFSPSTATPVAMAVKGKFLAANNFYYLKEGQTVITNQSPMSIWSGLASSIDSENCLDFRWQPIIRKGDKKASEFEGYLITCDVQNPSEAYGDARMGLVIPEVSIYLKSVFYTPPERNIVLEEACRDTGVARHFYSHQNTESGGSIPLNFTKEYSLWQEDLTSIKKMLDLVKEEKMCALSADDEFTVWWNEKFLLEDEEMGLLRGGFLPSEASQNLCEN